MITKADKNAVRKKRHARVRRTITGTAARPRLNVFRSSKHIYVQLIDDAAQTTLVSASSKDKALDLTNGGNVEAAKAVGKLAAEDKSVDRNVPPAPDVNTSNLAPGVLVPIPILPPERIRILSLAFVSTISAWLSLVPNVAVVPKLLPPC